MKRILIFLVVLLPFLAKSQTVITGKYKYTDSLTFAKYKNNSTLDSVLSVDQNGRLRLAPRTGLDTTSLSNRIDARVKYTDTANMLIPYLRKLDTTGKWLSVGYLPYLVKYSDTAAFLSAYYNKTAIDARLALKLNISDTANMLSPYVRTSNLPSLAPYVKYTDTASMLSPYYRTANATAALALKLNISDTANMLSSYYNKTATDSKLALKLNISDTANMLSPYARTLALGGYVPYSGATKDVNIGTKNYYGNAYFDGFTSVAASGTLITLTVSSTPSYLITGSGGQTIKLPDATTLPNGAIYVFNNNQSSGAINVNNNSNTLVKSVPSGGYLNLELIDNSTVAGSWDAHFQAPSNVSWSTNTFDYPGSITSATWNGNTIAINRGGTGASTSGGALTNLGAQPQLNGTGFVKASGTTISYDNSTYLTSADIAGKVNYTDTATMLSPYSRDYNTVHKAGVETIGGFKTFSNYTTFVDGADVIVGTTYGASGATGRFNGGIVASRGINFDNLRSPSIYANTQAFYINKSGLVSTLNIRNDTTSAYAQILQFNNNMATHYYYFPDATGTVALTSDIPSITGKLNISDTAAMLSGYKTYYPRTALSFTAGSGAYNNSTGVITIPTNTNQLTNGAGFITGYTETDPIVKAINGIVKSNGTTISAAVAGTDYVSPSGLTTALSSYLPLSGGTLTGQLNGANAVFALNNGSSPSTFLNLTNSLDADLQFKVTQQAASAKYSSISPSTATPLALSTTSGSNLLVGTTTDAGYKFDVNGTGRFLSGLYVQASGNSDLPFINFSNNGVVYNWGRIGALLQGDGDGSLYFQTKLGGGLTTKLTINSTGAATFNSSITAGDQIRITGSTANALYLFGASGTKPYILINEYGISDWVISAGQSASGTLSITKTLAGTDGIIINGAGKVGIGTTSPQDKLDVNGSIRFRANTPNFTAVLDNGVLDYVPTSIFATSPVIRLAAIGTSTVGAGISFQTGTSTTLSEAMRIASGGNVGIGTSTPLMPLNIASPYSKTNTTGFSLSFLATNPTLDGNPFGLRTMVYGGGSTASRYITLQTTEYSLVDGGNIVLQPAAGNVMIGTTTDNGAKLQVNGTITTQGQAWKINSAFAGTPAMGGNVLSISINGTTYYIQLYTTTL